MSLYVDIHKKLGAFSLDISFDTDREVRGILGASGCGKSMTLKCIAGIVKPDEGRIVLNDRVLFDSEKKIDLTPQQRRVGYLFQNYALFPGMTVEQNIGIGIRGAAAGQKKQKTVEMLETFDLTDLAKRYPGQLSGGQQQRVALARILAYEPEVLMLDEPFSALDTFLKEQMHFEVQKMLKVYTGDVLMVTHSRDEVYRFCDSVVIMDRGRTVEQGEMKELFAHPKTITTAKLSGCKNFSAAEKRGDHLVYAKDWNVLLQSTAVVPDAVQMVGIRAHEFVPEKTRPETNGFHLRVYDVSEGPFEVSVRMTAEGNDPEDDRRLIWWKTDSEAWKGRFRENMPEYFRAAPEAVMPLTD